MPTVAATIAQTLYDAGVRIVFGMPGGEVVAVLEAMQRFGIRFELMHHEESAVLPPMLTRAPRAAPAAR